MGRSIVVTRSSPGTAGVEAAGAHGIGDAVGADSKEKVPGTPRRSLLELVLDPFAPTPSTLTNPTTWLAIAPGGIHPLWPRRGSRPRRARAT